MDTVKNIMISGGSRGIGYQTALEFCRLGHQVFVISRNASLLDGLAQAAADSPGHLYIKVGDVREFERSWLPTEFKLLDIVIHNAGSLLNRPFAEIAMEELAEVYAVNVFAPFKLTQDLLPVLSKKAHLIYIGSVGGVNGTQKFPGLSAYSSSKAAVSCLCECLQAEYADTSWSFNSLALGAVQTEMLQAAFPGYQANISAGEMGAWLCQFALYSGGIIKGKTLLISNSNP